jgi:hypothetical protein
MASPTRIALVSACAPDQIFDAEMKWARFKICDPECMRVLRLIRVRVWCGDWAALAAVSQSLGRAAAACRAEGVGTQVNAPSRATRSPPLRSRACDDAVALEVTAVAVRVPDGDWRDCGCKRAWTRVFSDRALFRAGRPSASPRRSGRSPGVDPGNAWFFGESHAADQSSALSQGARAARLIGRTHTREPRAPRIALVPAYAPNQILGAIASAETQTRLSRADRLAWACALSADRCPTSLASRCPSGVRAPSRSRLRSGRTRSGHSARSAKRGRRAAGPGPRRRTVPARR